MKKDTRKYFFVGMRFYCLEEMLKLNLNIVNIVTLKGSFVEKECKKRKLKYKIVKNKNELIDLIIKTQFDILVSNGCPYILPISKIRKGNELYINIHPSLLPDLRGINPINGSILFDRPQGATCHYIDDGIDTGNIISQVRITKKSNIPLDLLYRLSFMAEAKAFVKAYKLGFKAQVKQSNKKGIYYSRKEEDQIITKHDSLCLIERKVKAFQVEGQYARVIRNNKTYIVKDLSVIDVEFLSKEKYKQNEIILIFDNNILTKTYERFVLWRLDSIEGLKIKDVFIK